MTGRKPLAVRVRERAWVIHRRNHGCEGRCWGPDAAEREQATREVMRGETRTP